MFLNSTLETPEALARQKRGRPGLVLAAAAVVQFLVSLDLSVVNVGLPQIATGLGFSALGLTWVIHAYALTFGGLLLLGGKAADRYGRKRMLLLGLGLFGSPRRPAAWPRRRVSSSPPGRRRASARQRWLRPRSHCSPRPSPPAGPASAPSASGARRTRPAVRWAC